MAEHRLACPEKLDKVSGGELLARARRVDLGAGDCLVLDFSETRKMNSLGAAWLVQIADWVHGRQGDWRCVGQQGDVAEFMELVEPGLHAVPDEIDRDFAFFQGVGGRALGWIGEVRQFLGLVVDAIYWTFIGPVEGRGFRWSLLMDELHEMGVRAIPINSLMNFLLGMIIAMLAAPQAEALAAPILVAILVVVGFTRELAAVMTAVVVSARTGAAITAEIATMQVQEEVDALRGMGFNVPQYLVAPKVVALLIVMPCLVALGMVFGYLGGTFWGVGVMDVEPRVWIDTSRAWATPSDVFQGLFKAVVFAVVIGLVGCHNGFRVAGGSRGVGLMTTRTVVMCIFFIIVIDMAFAAMFYYVL